MGISDGTEGAVVRYPARAGYRAIALATACLGVSAPVAAADTFSVNRTDDPDNTVGQCSSGGSCSLRQAINAADAAAGSTVLVPQGPVFAINLSSLGSLQITHGMTIQGQGVSATTITPKSGTFGIPVDVTQPGTETVTIRSLKITGAAGVFVSAPAIYAFNGGPLTLQSVELSGNEIGLIGSPNTTVVDSTIDDNASGDFGGAGISELNGELTVIDSTVANNSVGASNSASGHAGGGISVKSTGGHAASATIVNSTISGNQALGNGVVSGTGSGSVGGNLLADAESPGSTAQITLANTIVAGGQATAGGGDCATIVVNQGVSTFSSSGGNVEQSSPAQCGLGANDIVGVDPLLGPLEFNGADTNPPTMAITPPSPAIDYGTGAGCPAADETGSTVRPQGPACDAGAFEFPYPSADFGVSQAASSPQVKVGDTVTFTIIETNAGPGSGYGTVTETLPAGLKPGAASISTGGACTTSAQRVSCPAPLASGATATMTVAATALAGGTQTATAAVTGFYTDPSATNDRASAAVSVAMPPTATTGDATSLTSSSAHLGGTVNPGLATVNDCHFEYGTTTAYGSSVPCAASPGSGGDPVRVSAAVTGLSPGTTYHFRLVATNALGSTHGADASFATPAAVIPVLSRLKLSRKRFHAASRGQSIAAGATRVGTTVTYTDSLPATTRFVVIRKVAGVRRGARCVAPRGRLRKHVKRCTRRVSAGSFTHADAAGPNRFRFTGRVAHKRLRPGKYLLSASASSPAGASAPVSARFTIAR